VNLGDRVRVLRQQRGWSQSRLSQESGIPQPTIWRLERGLIKEPKLGQLKLLAKAFGITIDELSKEGKQMSFEDLKGDTVAEVLLRGYEALPHEGRQQLSGFAQWLVEQHRKKRKGS